jgi:hypothetical protein
MQTIPVRRRRIRHGKPLIGIPETVEISADTYRGEIMVDTNGLNTILACLWGTDINLEGDYRSVIIDHQGIINQPMLVNFSINNLDANTLYYYKITAENGNGIVESEIYEFMTLLM